MPTEGALILDLDGTLIDTSARHYATYCTIADQLSLVALPQADYWARRRAGQRNDQVLAQSGMHPEQLSAALAAWKALIESDAALRHDQLINGAPAWLELAASHFALALVTLRSQSAALEAQLAALALGRFFHWIVPVPHGENDAEAKAQHVRAALPDHIVAWIGDSEVDMAAARLVGATAIGVTSGMRPAAALLAAGASAVYPTIAGLDVATLAMLPLD